METIKPEQALPVEDLMLKKGALVFRAIRHPLRQQMLYLLHNNKQMTVTALYNKLNLEQSVASQHLSILRKARFVTTRREGKFIFYSVNYSSVDHVQHLAMRLNS